MLLLQLTDAKIPWIMCNGQTANNTINACNSLNGTEFIENHGQTGRILIDQPALWTENEGGYQEWSESPSKNLHYEGTTKT